ncbi:MAG TPA: AgmX/PglI C-terminal domain-containing protein, partial [Polyangiaceae bacterium]
MSETTTPPPPKSGSGGFLAAAAIMLLAMGGLIYWKVAGDEVPSEPVAPPPTVAAKEPEPELDLPPPPPPPVEKDAAADAEPEKQAVKRAPVNTGCSGECGGREAPQLRAVLSGKAAQARGCYERALRQNPQLEGRLAVAMRIGLQGQVCSASLVNDGLGDPAVATCVL